MVPIRPSNTFACERGCRTRILPSSAGLMGSFEWNVVLYGQRWQQSHAVGDTCYPVVRLMFFILSPPPQPSTLRCCGREFPGLARFSRSRPGRHVWLSLIAVVRRNGAGRSRSTFSNPMSRSGTIFVEMIHDVQRDVGVRARATWSNDGGAEHHMSPLTDHDAACQIPAEITVLRSVQ